MKNSMKKRIAFLLATVMAVAAPLTAFAADGDLVSPVTGEEKSGNVFYHDVQDLILPTNLTFAMNPQGLEIGVNDPNATAATDGSGKKVSTDQIISQAVGIANKSTRGKIVKMRLNVSVPEGVVVTTSAGVNSEIVSQSSVKAMNLQLISGTFSNIISGGTAYAPGTDNTAINSGTAVAAFGNIKVETALNSDTQKIDLQSGNNTITFALSSAAFTAVGSGAGLGAENMTNDARKYFGLDDAAEKFANNDNLKVAFKFSGSMNQYAKWSELAEQMVKMKIVYEISDWFGGDESTNLVTGTRIYTPTRTAMTKNTAGGYYFVIPSSNTSDAVSSFYVDDTERPGVVTNNNALVVDKDGEHRFVIMATAVQNFGWNEGTHNVDVKIGSEEYTLKIQN